MFDSTFLLAGDSASKVDISLHLSQKEYGSLDDEPNVR